MPGKVKPYQDNLEYLQAQMALLNLRLLREAQRLRQSGADPSSGGEFKGLALSDQEAEAILARLINGMDAVQPGADSLADELESLHASAAARTAASLLAGASLRLEQLGDLFGLDDFHRQVLLLCLVPEMDLQYGTLYAYLQDDLGKRRPTVNLALNLFCSGPAQRLEYRDRFHSTSPLLQHQLLQVAEDPRSGDQTLLSKVLFLDARVADFLLGGDALDARLNSFARLARNRFSWDALVLEPETRQQLLSLAASLGNAPGAASLILQLAGPAGTGKKSVAQALSSSLGRPLLIVRCAGLLSEDGLASGQLVRLACREARLQGAVLCWDQVHLLAGDDPKKQECAAALFTAVRDHPGLTILSGETAWRPQGWRQEAASEQPWLVAELPRAGYAERLVLWERSLRGQEASISAQELGLLSSHFRFSGGQVQRAVATARDLARWRSWDGGQISLEDLRFAARWHSNRRLERLAQKVDARYSWEDLVLPEDQVAQLQEMCHFFRNMPLVYGQWGFQSKTSLGKGMNALFAGPSGTGKTMSAQVVASDLGLDLYRIDLSGVVSKYIGETEKNLERIFTEAQDSNAILLFDEADALFGKRSEVRDSHDRYANIEISFLLQKMEEYEGISILTTNFRKNMDDAFTRRLHFVVEFPFPEEEYRLQIWRKVFPSSAPVDSTVDLEFLARQLKVPGGNIKNIGVMAAFLAAQEGQPIGMRHVIRAARREYQKMGKLLVESEFGPYFGLVRGHRPHPFDHAQGRPNPRP
ncbi:MAG: AAA family ATPase [SAR202 cluster bacterium]|nr:AAA family ATPase [SAR202 cluster bacterium]